MIKYYKSIEELPIYNFNKVIETGELKYIVEKGIIDNKASIVWEIILEEFTEYVGFSDSYKEYMRYSKKSALLICQAYLENKMYLIAFARAAEKQAEAALGTGKQDFAKLVKMLSKFIGYRIDTKKETVKDFYAIIKLMEDGQNKAQ